MYGAPPMLQNHSTSQHSQSQRPDITHAWNEVKQPVLRGKKNSNPRYLRPLSRAEIVASIEASKKRHAEQKAQGLVPDNQQVFVRVRPSQKSLWGSFKEGVTYMANSLNEGVRQMDFLPSLPFSMAYGMPSSEKRITSSEDEALEKALSAMYGKLEEADHFVDELKVSISSLRMQIEESRKKPPALVPVPVPSPTSASASNNTTLTLPTGSLSYEQFRQYAESLGFEVEIWNPESHDVCDNSCNVMTEAWNGPSNTAVNIDGMPIISSRGNPDKMFLLMQAFVRPHDQIITTDEQFKQKEECLNLVQPSNCIISEFCNDLYHYKINLANLIRDKIKEGKIRIFIDLNEDEQNFIIKNLKNTWKRPYEEIEPRIPHIKISYPGQKMMPTNFTHLVSRNMINMTDDTVTTLDFKRYVEALGLSSRVSNLHRTNWQECDDTFDVRNTRLNDVLIVLSRGDAQSSLLIMQTFIRPGDVIITTNSDFGKAKSCLDLVAEADCIDQSVYCDSSVEMGKFWTNEKRWANVARTWETKINSIRQSEPNRRIFMDLSVDEHKALMRVIDGAKSGWRGPTMKFVLAAKEADLFEPSGDYVSIPGDVPSCESTTMSTAPTPTSAGTKTSQPAVQSNEAAKTIGAVLGGLGASAFITGALYWYFKRNQGEKESADNPSGVVVENDGEQYELQKSAVYDNRVENDNDNRA